MSFPHPLTARQRRIADLAEDLAQRLAPIAAEHDRRGAFALEKLATLHEAGYLRLALPEAFGGEGADAYDRVIAQQRLARADAASALVVGMTLNVLGG